jgi:hypothetical protein
MRVHQVSKQRNFMRNIALKKTSLEIFCPGEARHKLSEQERFHGYMDVDEEEKLVDWIGETATQEAWPSIYSIKEGLEIDSHMLLSMNRYVTASTNRK